MSNKFGHILNLIDIKMGLFTERCVQKTPREISGYKYEIHPWWENGEK